MAKDSVANFMGNVNFTFNETSSAEDVTNDNTNVNVMMLLSIVIASVGIVSNGTVVVAFLNHKTLRRKIPTMFIINQVSL